MARISNGLITILNILIVLVSLVVIGVGAYFSLQSNSDCEKFLMWPVLILGFFLLVISLLGIMGSCCGISFFLWIYLFAMFLLILVMLFLTVFVFIVTNKGVGDAVSGRGYKEYRLGDYSGWLQKQVGNYRTWSKIESCLKSAQVCHGFTEKELMSANEFYKKNLSPTQVDIYICYNTSRKKSIQICHLYYFLFLKLKRAPINSAIYYFVSFGI
jgi:Tetraspanin family